jgi:hypothetical protein
MVAHSTHLPRDRDEENKSRKSGPTRRPLFVPSRDEGPPHRRQSARPAPGLVASGVLTRRLRRLPAHGRRADVPPRHAPRRDREPHRAPPPPASLCTPKRVAQIIVGTPARAEALAARFDAAPAPFRLGSERAFLTLTGRVRGVPVSVASIGMGFPNVDFFIREARECVDGDMVVVRCAYPGPQGCAIAEEIDSIGSCGCLRDVPVGTLVVPRASVAVSRNYDFDFAAPASDASVPPYLISRPVRASPSSPRSR